jgi:hypothetical protein
MMPIKKQVIHPARTVVSPLSNNEISISPEKTRNVYAINVIHKIIHQQ